MLIAIDEKDPRPIYAQIAAAVKEQVRSGALRSGDELPGVRELAESLQVNMHTVHHAYRELRQQGVIRFRLGRRARVSETPRPPADPAAVEALSRRLNELITDAFHMGLPPESFRLMVEACLKEKGGKGDKP
jgi:GntR family transcriptional regulator